MSETIRIQMMDEFVIYLNERQADHMVNKSKKGLALIEYLIANRGGAGFQPPPALHLLER